MHQKHRCKTNAAVALIVAGLLVWPATTVAHLGGRSSASISNITVVGTASAVRATTLGVLGGLGLVNTGTTTVLSDTGTLGRIGDARDASQTTGGVASLLAGEVLSASSISYPNEVDSQASLANLGLSVPGATIVADSVVAQASQVLGAAGTGSSAISNLSVNGVPVFDPNKLIKYDPLKVKKIDIVKRKYFYGPLIFNGIVNFTTYSPDPSMLAELDPVIMEYEGLQYQREFYSPVYETQEEISSRLPDFRNVLYWSPGVQTDAQGKTEIDCFTSDLKGKFIIVLQGMSTDGRAGEKSISFEVR